MAWAHGQTNATFSGSTASPAHTYGSAVAAGSLLVCIVAWEDITTTISGVSDDLNGAWTQIGSTLTTNGRRSAYFYFPNSGAGTPTITATLSGAIDSGIVASAFTGLDAVPLDVQAGQAQTNPGTGTDACTSGDTAATAQDNSLVLAWGLQNTTLAFSTMTIGTAFVNERFNADLGFAMSVLVEDYNLVTSGGAVAGTMTISSASVDPNMQVAVFKEPAAGGGVSIPVVQHHRQRNFA